MSCRIISYSLALDEHAWARVYLNDLPLYRSPFVGPDSRSGPINFMLVPGENEIRVELLKVKPPADPDTLENAFFVQLYETMNLDAGETVPLERRLLADVQYPTIWHQVEEAHRHFPFHYTTTFELDVELPRPLFLDAPVADFDCAGTPELRQAVERLYLAIERQDYDELLDLLSLRFACDERAFGGVQEQTAAAKRQIFRDELFAYEPMVSEPLDWSMIHFEPRLEGRVAYVKRHDDRFVLEAPCRKDPKRRIKTDLLLMQHEGRWQVIA